MSKMDNKFTILSTICDGEEPESTLCTRTWDIAFLGDPRTDKRSKVACEFVKQQSNQSYSLRDDNNTLYLDDVQVTRPYLASLTKNAKSILVEATTLACPELIAIIRASVKQEVRHFSFLYLEPVEYRRKIKGNLTQHRDFDLSENFRFRSVHGCMNNLAESLPGQAIFFLGYEKSRLGTALEQQEMLRKWQKHAVFGVPGYQAGWEIDALANNAHHLSADRFNIQYVAADSVNAAYQLLNALRKADKTEKPILVCPLGTKPHTIATSLFLVEHNEDQATTLLFDHPKKASERSTEVRRWHIYDVFCSD